jgi:hypothetical protein
MPTVLRCLFDGVGGLGLNWWSREPTKQWMMGVSPTNNYHIFFWFFATQLHADDTHQQEAASFGSSELSGRTAPGLSLATWGGSFVPDAAPDVFIPYGAPHDSLCAKWEERKVILWFSHVRTTQKWIRTRHTRQIVSIYQITETMWRIFFIWGVINFY